MREIFFHELRRMWRDRTGFVVAATLFCMSLFGAYNGARHVSAQKTVMERILDEEHEAFSKMQAEARAIETGERPRPFFGGPLHAGMVGLFYPRKAILPPAPFAFSSIGQTDVYPGYFKVSGERRESFTNAQEMENPTNLMIGRFDLAFVVIYLLPLFALALSYNLLSSEREMGTLTLLRAQGVNLSRLLGGKLAAQSLLTITPVILAAVVAAEVFDGEQAAWARVLIFTAVVVFYAAFWFALAGVINIFNGMSAANAVTLGLSWVLIVLLIPATVLLTAVTLLPVPSRLELITISRDLQTETRQPVQYLEEYYAEYPDRRPIGKDLTKYDFPLYWAAIQREMENRTAPLLEKFEAAQRSQQAFVRTASVLSPTLAAQESLNGLAETGFERHHAFVQQVKDFHREHRAFFEVKTFRAESLAASDFDLMPRFKFKNEALSDLLLRLGQYVLVLFVMPSVVSFFIWFRITGRSGHTN